MSNPISKLKKVIYQALSQDKRLWTIDNELNQTLLIHLLEKTDPYIIELLFQQQELRKKFFIELKETHVFKLNDFRFFMEENKVDNSYTTYKNSIGLTAGKRFIKDAEDIVLSFPYKDCVLQGGQSTEEGMDTYFAYEEEKEKIVQGEKIIEPAGYKKKQAKRKEIFFNEVLAQNEKDRLFDEKALVGWKRYTTQGEEEVQKLSRDKNDTLSENMIIKGNNLLALHSLKRQFAGKVKLIYIDPPYNTGHDGFQYNDKFNHSTWLTFMKNRLEVARELLREDGVICVQCDDNEQAYLKVLMDETLGKKNFVNTIVWLSNLKGRQISKQGATVTKEYCMVYAKNLPNISVFKAEIDHLKKDMPSIYKGLDYEPQKDEWGPYVIKNELHNTNSFFNEKTRPSLVYDIFYNPKTKQVSLEQDNSNSYIKIAPKKIPHTNSFYAWRWSKEKVLTEHHNLFFDTNATRVKIYTKVRNFKETTFKDIIADINTSHGNKELSELGFTKMFLYPKPEKYMRYLIAITTQPKDIILDYHLGSGTTAAVAHKMGRQYIGIEQMDYIETIACERMKKVITGEQGGISKSVQWQGGGDFIYMELAEWNEKAKKIIQEAKSLERLKSFFHEMCDKYFLHYNLKVKDFTEKVIHEEAFQALSLAKQKSMFLTMLDLNQMYVCQSEMNDPKFAITSKDQNLTKAFYLN